MNRRVYNADLRSGRIQVVELPGAAACRVGLQLSSDGRWIDLGDGVGGYDATVERYEEQRQREAREAREGQTRERVMVQLDLLPRELDVLERLAWHDESVGRLLEVTPWEDHSAPRQAVVSVLALLRQAVAKARKGAQP